MIDIHCHILPGLDDGASSVEQSLEMARQAVEDGIHTVVATPHTENGVYSNPAIRVRKQVGILREMFEDMNITLMLCPGCEVRLCDLMGVRIISGEITTINDTGRYILLEFPELAIPQGYKEEIFDLRLRGITPVIAHPERNPIFQENNDILIELVNAGCLLQLTAMSITGDFGEEAAKFAYHLLEHRMASVIATDAHGWGRRKLALSHAVEIAARVMGDREAAQSLVTTNPRAIITGSPLIRPESEKYPKKKWFSNLWQ